MGEDDLRTSLGCAMEKRYVWGMVGRKDSGSGMEPVLEREEARARAEGQIGPIILC